MKKNLLILALFVISNGLIAQRTIWAPGGDNNGAGYWANPDNWSNTLPGSELDGRAIFRGGDCYVASDVSTEALDLPGDYRLELGDNQDDNVAKLTIEDGGYVAALRNSRSEIGIWSPAIFTLEEGGEITFGEHEMLIASSKDDGSGNNAAGTEVHLNGGIMTVNGLFGIDFFNDKTESGGTLFLNGGTLVLADENGWHSFVDPDDPEENMSIGKNGKIEYTSGLMQIAGNHKTSLEAYRDIGRITGDFEIWLDSTVTETETTYVTKLSKDGPTSDPVTDATLSNLTLSEGTLDPVFDAATYNYTAELPSGTTATPTVTATTTNANATVDITDATDVTSEDEADRTTTIVVTAEDSETELTYSVVFNVSTTGVHDLSPDNLIYPNPASSRLYISHAVKIDRVEIYSITGSRVFSQNNISTEAIDISELYPGLYFISVTDVNNINIVKKFQKQ